jgi:PTS system beta-glucosides-specific IIC component
MTDLLAPVTGKTTPLADCGDAAFASGALGPGIAIVPKSGEIYAPVTGTLTVAFPTGHAYGLLSDDGVEVLVHVGIDTVRLKGAGFGLRVTQGQRVQAGDLLCVADLRAIRRAGYATTTLMVVTNAAALASVTPIGSRRVKHGDPVVTVVSS